MRSSKKDYQVKLEDIVDIEAFQKLQDDLNNIFGFPSAIIDNEGNVLTSTAWQDICTQFHRKHPQCKKECIKMEQYVRDHLEESDPSVNYTCEHGLTDTAIPIIIDGIHLANFFTGRFFLQKPDMEFFRMQARQYGFDEAGYLDALVKVPVWNNEKMKQCHKLILDLAGLIKRYGKKSLEHMKLKDSIRKKDVKFNSQIDILPQGVFYQEAGGVITEANDSALRMLGLTKKELLNRTSYSEEWDIRDSNGQKIEPEQHPSMLALATGKTIRNFELSVFNPGENKYRWFIINATPEFRNNEKSPFQVMVSMHDISDRKIIEEELTMMKYAIDKYDDGAYWHNINNEVIYVNSKGLESLGYTYDELMGRPISFINPLATGEKLELVWKKLRTEGNFQTETMHRRKDGTMFPVEVHTSYFVYRGKEYACGFARDITRRKEAENRFFLNKKRLEQAVSLAKLGYWEYDFITDTFTFDDDFYSLFGTSAEKAGGYKLKSSQYARRFVHPLDRKMVRDEIEKAVKTIDPEYFRDIEHRVIFEDGSVGYISVRFSIIKDQNGKTIRSVGVNQNITERKKKEEELRESEEKLRLLMDNSGLGIGYWDTSGNLLDFNKVALKEMGGKKSDFIGCNIRELYGSKNGNLFLKRFRKAINSARPLQFTDKIQFDDKERWYKSVYTAIKDKKGRVDGIQVISSNVTRTKIAEDALSKSEKRFRQVAENSEEWIWEVDNKGLYTYCSSAVSKILGYSKEELVGRMHFYDLFEPAVRQKLKRMAFSMFRAKRKFKDFINPNISKNGSVVLLSTSGIPVLDRKGNMTGYRGVDKDITERIISERELRESESRFRSIFENAPVGMALLDLKGNFLKVNASLCKFLGYKRNELISANEATFTYHEDIAICKNTIRRAVRKIDRNFEIEKRFITKSGKVVWAKEHSHVHYSEENMPLYFITQILGIDDIRNAIDKIRSSESEFRSLFENSLMAISHGKPDGGLLRINDAYVRLYGYRSAKQMLKEVKNSGVQLFSDPSDRKRVLDWLSENDIMEPAEFEIKKRNGQKARVLVTARVVRDKNGNVEYFQAEHLDISELKKTELALKENEEKLDLALRSAEMGVWYLDIDNNSRSFDRQTCKLLGIDFEGFRGTAGEFYSVVYPDDRKQLAELLNTVIETGGPYEPEFRIVKPDGEIRYMTARAKIVEEIGGGKRGVLGIIWDVTEKKQIENILRQKVKELEIFNTVTIGRELKMIELKKEINSLLVTLGRKEKYKIVS